MNCLNVINCIVLITVVKVLQCDYSAFMHHSSISKNNSRLLFMTLTPAMLCNMYFKFILFILLIMMTLCRTTIFYAIYLKGLNSLPTLVN